MRMRALSSAFVAFAAVVSGVRADTPAPAEPTIVVRLKSFDGLLADAKYVAELAGQTDKAKEVEAIVQALAGPKGLAGTGLDTKRPFAIYGMVGAAGFDSKAVIMIPVADESAFLETASDLLGRANVPMKKGADGVYSVSIPNAPVEAFVRIANRYAYIAVPDRSALDPEKLLSPTNKALDAQDGQLIGVTVNLDRIPDTLKQIALSQLEVQLANAKEKKEPNETQAQSALKTQIVDHAARNIRLLLSEGRALEARFALDRKAGELSFEVHLSGKPGSELAREIAADGNRRSVFGGLQAEAAQLALNLVFPDRVRNALSAAVDEGIDATIAKEPDPAKKDMIGKALRVIAPTVKAGVLDLFAGFDGPNAAGHFAVFGGLRVEDGKGIERVIKDLANKLPEGDRKGLKFDAATIAGVSVHRIDPKIGVTPDAKRLFGEHPVMFFAFRPDAVLVSLGDASAAGSLKSLVESKPAAAAAFFDVRGSVARLVAIDPDRQGDAKKAAQAIFGGAPAGSDLVRFSVQGGDAFRLQITLKTDIIKFGSRLGVNVPPVPQ